MSVCVCVCVLACFHHLIVYGTNSSINFLLSVLLLFFLRPVVCQTVGRAESVPGGGAAPGFACLSDNENITHGIYKADRHTVPWDNEDETEAWIKKIRPFFHMISWEYGDQKPLPSKSLMKVNWEDPHLLSVMIIRHPVERILAADANVFRRYPGLVPKAKDVLFHHEYEANMTLRHQYWWDYANGTSVMSTRNSNNFALRILSDPENISCERLGLCVNRAHCETAYVMSGRLLM